MIFCYLFWNSQCPRLSVFLYSQYLQNLNFKILNFFKFIAKTEIGCQFGPIARQNTFGGFPTQDFLHKTSNDEKNKNKFKKLD